MSERVAYYKERYEKARAAYTNELDAFERRQKQYDGDKDLGGGRAVKTVWNITAELIESQIDSNIPKPKVTPIRPSERSIRNARIIEDMIKAQLDRLPSEQLNDEEERAAKVDGGSVALIEWDNNIKTHDTTGDVSLRLVGARQFIPQQAVFELRYMDYLFLTFDETKERIKQRYGKDVAAAGIDPQASDAEPTADDIVTQVICYYKNKRGGLGCVSWVDDIVLVDDDNYEARKDKICAACGKSKGDGDICVCGGGERVKRDKDYEYLTDELQLFGGTDESGNTVFRTVPAVSPQKDESGEYLFEDYEEPVFEADPDTGAMLPAMDYIFDERGLPTLGDDGLPAAVPRTQTKQRPLVGPTRIPYYYPHQFPVSIRKNISKSGCALGLSDCDTIKDLQLNVNRMLTKRDDVIMKSGSVIPVPKEAEWEFKDEALTLLRVDPQYLNAVRAVAITADISQFTIEVDRDYDKAKSVTGVTDSYQGKPDITAVSGRAKEAQIAQAAGRQRSKQVMKNAAWADKYEMIFKFMLAYSDEPRAFNSVDDHGRQVQRIFNKYDFLEQDESGEWYYDDGYLFSVDESGLDANNKQFMLEDLRTDFGLGAYGNPQDPETILRYWEEKDAIGYPNAARNVDEWRRKVAEARQMQEQMQIHNAELIMQNEGGGTGGLL